MKIEKGIILVFILLLKPIQAENSIGFLNGLWIDEGYDYTLRNACSPRAASNVTIVPAISIDTSSKTITISYNFHESIGIKLNGFNKKAEKVYVDNNEYEISFQNKSLIFSHKDYGGKIRKRLFLKISSYASDNIYDSVSKYATSMIINGDYFDSNNTKYTFNNNEARWNAKHFRWLIIFDCVEWSPIDVLCESDSNQICKKTYGFVSNGDVLQIYEYNDDKKIIGKILYDLIRKKQ